MIQVCLPGYQLYKYNRNKELRMGNQSISFIH